MDFSGMIEVEKAASLLRRAESNVTAPTAETNPFGYLKQMCPNFSNVIDIITTFWNDFSSSEIRKKYNYCKHKGKPAYEEIESFRNLAFMGFFVRNETGDHTRIAANSQDVQWIISLNDSIAELHEFDDEVLFPYLSSLKCLLEDAIDISPVAT